MTRREVRLSRCVAGVLGGLVLLTGVLPSGLSVTAQTSLPLVNLGLEHLDIVVPDPIPMALNCSSSSRRPVS